MRVWIDTDVGSDVDDALAIAYVMRRPELELVGLSTVFGDVELRTRIAKRLLEIGAAGNVPVVTGLGRPLTAARIGRMFGHEGQGLLDDARPVMKTLGNPGAEERLDRLEKTIEATRPDVVVSIGPMTNLGALARRDVSLPPLTVMGGHVDRTRTWPDSIPGIPEWNWWCDAEAVDDALAASTERRPLVVPGEVTFGTELMRADLDRLAGGGALCRALGALAEAWLACQRDVLGAATPRVRLHDPLTVAALVDPTLAPSKTRRIQVDAGGVTHERARGIDADVAYDTNNEALRDHLLATWLG